MGNIQFDVDSKESPFLSDLMMVSCLTVGINY